MRLLFALLVSGLSATVFVCCQNTTTVVENQPAKKEVDVARKVVDISSDAARNQAAKIDKRLDHIVHPEPHIGGQHSMPISAFKGTGRLFRDVAVESGKFTGTVSSGALKLQKKLVKAFGRAAKESGTRLINGRQ